MNSRALPLLALIISAIIFFGYVSPTWRGPIKETKATIASNDAALSAASAYAAQQHQLAEERSALRPADLDRVTVFLPDSVDNVRVILDLDALAAKSGLLLTNINVAESSGTNTATAGGSTAPAQGGASGTASRGPANPVSSIDLTLSASGTYSALQTFLKGIERSGRLLDVRELSVKGSNTGAYGYQMTVRLYWLH